MAGKQVSQLRECFFTTVFSLLGYIANSDGSINSKELRRTRVFMEKMELTPECKEQAQALFNAGAKGNFDLQHTLDEFRSTARKTPNIVQVLLVYLISMATTDGPLRKEERAVVQQVADELGYSSIIFEHLLKMIAAQDRLGKTETPFQERAGFQERTGRAGREESSAHTQQNHAESKHKTSAADRYLAAAFKALNLSPNADDAEVKRAYRKLVSQFHPDKLIDQGLPPELLTAATDRFRTIRTAYEYIKKNRFASQAA